MNRAHQSLLMLLLLICCVAATPLLAQGAEGHTPDWAGNVEASQVFPAELTSIGDKGWSERKSDPMGLVSYRARVQGSTLIVEANHDRTRWAHSYALDNDQRGGYGMNTTISVSGVQVPASEWRQYGLTDLTEAGYGEWGYAAQAFFTTELSEPGESVSLTIEGQVCDDGNCYQVEPIALTAPVHADGLAAATGNAGAGAGGDASAAAQAAASEGAAFSEWKEAGEGSVKYRVKLGAEKLFVEIWHNDNLAAHTYALDNIARGGESQDTIIEVSGASIGAWQGPTPEDVSDFESGTINYGYTGRVLLAAPLLSVDEEQIEVAISSKVSASSNAEEISAAVALVFELGAPAQSLSTGDWSYWTWGPERLVKYRARVSEGHLEVQAWHDESVHAHTYAMDNKARDGYSPPTSFTVSGASVGEWQQPEVKDISVGEGSTKMLDFGFTGEVIFKAKLIEKSGPITVTISGQVCDDRACYAFDSKPLVVELGEVGDGSAPPPPTAREEADTSTTLRLTDDGRVVMNPFGGKAADASDSWGEFILFCILGGLIALLMPCVYPMIPITVSFFSKQAEATGKPTSLLAVIYGLGLMGSYTGLGFILTWISDDSVSAFGGNPWVASAIGLFFLVFAMSMLGMFELRLPYSIAQKFNLQGKGQANGTIGALLLGLTFAVTSMACTVPVVGSILALASTGDAWKPLIGMLIYSGTVALPFVALGLLPGLLKKIPKAGGWMNSIKVVFGFVELAAAAEFFGWALLISRETVLAIWVACALLSALYLLGLFRGKYDPPTQGLSGGRILAASLFLAAGLWVSTGLYGGKLGYVESFLINETSTGWQKNVDLEQALADAKEKRQKVFLDFTGTNCTNCRRFEDAVLEKDWAKEALEDFVKLKLYMDNDDHGEAYTAFTKNLFNAIGQPQYVVINADGRITAYTADIFLVLQHDDEAAQQEAFQEFLDSSNTKGYEFDPNSGFKVSEAEKAALQE